MKHSHTPPILLLFFVGLATSIVTAGGLLYHSQRESCLAEADRDLATIADLKVNDISAWRRERLGDAGVFLENSAFSGLMRRCIEQPRDLHLRAELRSWLDRVQTSYHYDRIALFDAKGDPWMMVSGEGEPLSTLTLQKVRETIHTRQLAFDDFCAHEHTHKVYLRLFVPISAEQAGGPLLGVLVLRMDPSLYLYPFVQRWPMRSNTGETLLIRREGNDVVFLNELRFQKDTALTLRVSMDRTDRLPVKAMSGHDGLIEGLDYRETPVLGVVRTVPNSPWFLVAKIDAAEVYAPMRKWFWLTVIFVGILLYGVRVAWAFLWQREHLKLFREKHEIESKCRAITDAAQDAILMMDTQGRITYWNPAAERILGYTTGEAIGRDLHQFIAPQRYRAAHQTAFPEFQHAGRGAAMGKTLEMEARRKDGTEIAVTLSVSAIQIGAEWHAVGILRDDTERKRAEAAIKKSETMLACVLNSIPQSIFWKDRESVYVGCNDVFARRAGLRPPDIAGKSDFDLPWSQEEAKGYRADDREVMVSGRAKIHIIEQQHQPDGSCIWVDTTKIPLVDSEGQVFGVLGVYEDITASKLAEDALRRSRDEIEQYAAALETSNQALEEFGQFAESATRAKSEFLANMSHEIRTPLTAILGYADLMLDENVGHVAREHIAIIKRNGEHLLGLINDILDLSKVEAGKLQIEPTRCSPVELVAEVASLMRVRAEAKRLRLETDCVGPLPETVLTDPLRLRQVLVNLVGNAIKFTDQGKVCLAVQLVSDGGVSRLRFDVTDTGIGMNTSQIGKLFQPFTQVDNSSARKFGGTGLGLCLSKGMAEALGGEIEVRSSPEQGSTFIVTIDPGPLDGIRMIRNAQGARFDGTPTTTAAPAEKTVLHGRILLAEDGPDNRRLICLLLRKAGADVTAVENGQLAVEAAMAAREAGKPFELILMDMQMPVMDGYTATRQLREQGYTAPIVALTAHAMTEDAKKCLDAGCDDYATKPINRQTFLATVSRWTTHGGAQEAIPHQVLGQ